jgi:L-lactate dehydrogenase (cytochrome)
VVGKRAPLNDFQAWIHGNFDASVTWKDVEWVRSQWDGPLVIKGILDPDDARAAVASGASGIVVSNHGGRQLDGAIERPCTSAIADAIAGRFPCLPTAACARASMSFGCSP